MLLCNHAVTRLTACGCTTYGLVEPHCHLWLQPQVLGHLKRLGKRDPNASSHNQLGTGNPNVLRECWDIQRNGFTTQSVFFVCRSARVVPPA
jgi:hypothetical protein